MNYKVRIYCHTSFEIGACEHNPNHPFMLPETFKSINDANNHGDKIVAQYKNDEIEWEVLDETGEVVC
jgi:hypothetical protein